MLRVRSFSTSMAMVAAMAAGCGGSSAVSLTQVAPGQQGCPTGGVLISDGTIAQVVCNGATQPTITTLPLGDPACPSGGIEIRAHQSDGSLGDPQKICSAPGGIVARSTNLAPGDAHCGAGGVKVEFSSVPPGSTDFDPNNIISTQFLCNPSSTPVGSLVAPDGAAGTAELLTRGGDGAGGAGGDGGNVSLTMVAGSLGGHVKIWKTGSATAKVAMPAAPASLDLGANPLTVASGVVTVAAATADSCAGHPAGSFYWFVDAAGAAHLRSCAADAAPAGATVTGISVSEGALLAFEGATCLAEGAFPQTACAKVSVAAACLNAGTITVNQGASTDAPRLALTCGSFRGESTSSIAVTPGGFAGVTSTGSLHNAGVIDVSQDPGAIDLSAAFGLVSTGNLLATGAPGGGPGGAVRIVGGLGGVAVSGVINTSGASGSTGGPAGPVSIAVAAGGGSLHSAASIRAVGGAGAASAGGAGGAVSLSGANGDVVVSGAIVTAGGASAAGAGGPGGAVTIGTSTQAVPGTGGTTVATGSVWLSAGIDARGGKGASDGGLGGSVSLTLDPGTAPAGQEIVLFGFKTVDASGGAGPSQGGAGGVIALANEASFANGGTAAGGSVVNAADLVASGGAGLPDPTKPGTGGAGGSITLDTQTKNAWPGIYPELAINSGALTANGGSGRSGGSARVSGPASLPAIRLSGRTGVTNAGTLAASGGAATDALAGQGGSIVLSSDAGAVDSQAGIRADGGAAVTTDPANGGNNTGGDGGAVQLTGATVKNSAPISAAGGGASALAGPAGSGGAVQMVGSTAPVANTGTMNVKGGTGGTDPGLDGTIVIDGVFVAP